jgi:uncharacterized protein YjbI with pentapeptide repeats
MVDETWTTRYRQFNQLLRKHGVPIAAVLGTFAAIVTGVTAIYTNVQTLKMMELNKKQIDAGQYNQYQGSIALAWRTIGAANGQLFETGQSISLLYLALNNELAGNITLNRSFLNLTTPNASKLIGEYNNIISVGFNLSRSDLCGTEIQKFPLRQGYTGVVFSYSRLNMSTFYGSFVSDDFLSVDAEKARFVNLRASNSRFAGADLREAVFHGGIYTDANFEGADLRYATTERGLLGFGSAYEEGVTFYDDNFVPGKIMWPSLLDDTIGINDMLTLIGRDPLTNAYENSFVDFSNANFKAADIRGADLRVAKISQAQIDQSCADETTKLPGDVRITHPCQQPPILLEKLTILRAPLAARSFSGDGCATTSKRAAPAER